MTQPLRDTGESILFSLRSLYGQHGYSHYKMNKFEEYDLYAQYTDDAGATKEGNFWLRTFDAKAVEGGGVAPVLRQGFCHGLHRLRTRLGGGGSVEIDHCMSSLIFHKWNRDCERNWCLNGFAELTIVNC